MFWNTIVLKKGTARLTKEEYKKFQKGDTIWGNDRNPEEIKRWNASKEDEAYEELKKYKCTYDERNPDCVDIVEYALELCDYNEDGEFVEGSDYDMAEEIEDV